MNRWSQLGNKQPTDNRHYTLKISGFIRFVVNLEKMNYTISLFVSECTIGSVPLCIQCHYCSDHWGLLAPHFISTTPCCYFLPGPASAEWLSD